MKQTSTTLESYDYFGLGTVVKRSHPQTGVDLNYIKKSGESVGDAGDQYTGLDRFGRIADQRWRDGSTEFDRYQYTYDRNGNRLTRTNALNSSLNESYGYDNLNQLTSSSVTGTSKSWDYDSLGNWDGVTTNGSTQTRTHNKQNEITAVSGATTPVFDAAGNMTTDETGKQYVYDAWNRLVTVKNSGGTTIATYAYDALTRRVSETASSVTTDLYYSKQWQVLEERVSGNAVKSYVWSPVYVDAMVARDYDTDSNGSLDQRIYPTHDGNFNITTLVNTSGTVAERFTYDPYGTVTFRDGSWSTTSDTYVWQYLHQGGRLSGQSELYSFRHREYSPTMGRWVTMDPIKYRAHNNNIYSYEFQNPLMLNDAAGMKVRKMEIHDNIDPIRDDQPIDLGNVIFYPGSWKICMYTYWSHAWVEAEPIQPNRGNYMIFGRCQIKEIIEGQISRPLALNGCEHSKRCVYVNGLRVPKSHIGATCMGEAMAIWMENVPYSTEYYIPYYGGAITLGGTEQVGGLLQSFIEVWQNLMGDADNPALYVL